jgi:AraC-like DNA-binding protein
MSVVIGDSDLLPRHAVFRTRDLDAARGHLCGVFAEHRVDFLPRERRLEFRHRQAKLGSIALNSLEWGAGVVVTAPLLPDFYLLQFTLTGACELWQEAHHSILSARSVTIVNPGHAFRKAWMPRTRQLLLRIDRRLVERELRAWSGGNEGGSLEFDVPPVEDLDTVGTLAHFVRMVCEDLKNEASDLSHPLVADRVASALVALLLTSMPHNKQRAIEAVHRPTAPFFVRRVEEFIRGRARDPITLADLTEIAGVSTRALQTSFRRFRNTTPMAHLRATRLELAQTELTSARVQGLSVAAVASALGFSHLGRFARDYQLRFGELPSQTAYRGNIRRSPRGLVIGALNANVDSPGAARMSDSSE